MLWYRYILFDWDKSLFGFRHTRRNRSRPSPIWVTQPQARSRHVPPAIPPRAAWNTEPYVHATTCQHFIRCTSISFYMNRFLFWWQDYADQHSVPLRWVRSYFLSQASHGASLKTNAGCRQLFIANSLKRASAFKTLSKPGFLLT